MEDEFDEYIEYDDGEEEEKGLALVRDHEHLMKDEDTGGVINTNEDEYEEYIRMRELKLQEQREKSSLKHEVDFLKMAVLELQQKLKELQNES